MKKILGVSLLELLITLTVIGIGLTIAVPSYHYFTERNQVAISMHRLFSALNFARSQAILSKQTVLICPYTKELTCGHDWASGMILFSKDKVIRVLGPFKNTTVHWNRKKNTIEFLSTGRLRGNNGTFDLRAIRSGSKQITKSAVIISLTGRIRLTGPEHV